MFVNGIFCFIPEIFIKLPKNPPHSSRGGSLFYGVSQFRITVGEVPLLQLNETERL